MPPHGKKFANYLHGSYPVQGRNIGGKIGTPVTKQYTKDRHYALATVGVNTFVTADGEYFNTPYFAETRDYKWMAQNRLIARDMLLGRNQRTWPVKLTENGQRVLAAWNAKYGPIETGEL